MSSKPRRLQVEFTTEGSFRSEYLGNIANGGVFVSTSEVFEVRSKVAVELLLRFCDQSITLEGEVVHVVTTEMASAGAERGVAVQFNESTHDLRARFEPLVGVIEGNERVTKSGRRTAPRAPARVKVRVTSGGCPEFETESRDLSASGIAIGIGEHLIPVGEFIQLSICHPRTGEEMGIEGRVVRHLESMGGEITAMGIAFEISDARKTEVGAFINEVRAVEHSRRLGGISGPIADLGIENLLQMFAAGSPRGTVVVTRGGEQGTIAFEGSMLRMVKLGPRVGLDALREMMIWGEGNFEFLPDLDIDEQESMNVPLSAAILEVLCALDESRRDEDRLDLVDLDAGLEVAAAPVSEPEGGGFAEVEMRITGDTIFRIDAAAADAMRSQLDKTEQAILDLTAVGMTIDRIIDVIPEPDIDIYKALEALQEYGIIAPR